MGAKLGSTRRCGVNFSFLWDNQGFTVCAVKASVPVQGVPNGVGGAVVKLPVIYGICVSQVKGNSVSVNIVYCVGN